MLMVFPDVYDCLKLRDCQNIISNYIQSQLAPEFCNSPELFFQKEFSDHATLPPTPGISAVLRACLEWTRAVRASARHREVRLVIANHRERDRKQKPTDATVPEHACIQQISQEAEPDELLITSSQIKIGRMEARSNSLLVSISLVLWNCSPLRTRDFHNVDGSYK